MDSENNRKMLKITEKLCKSCKYSMSFSAGMNGVACNYLCITKKRRGCAAGECDKYEKGPRITKERGYEKPDQGGI